MSTGLPARPVVALVATGGTIAGAAASATDTTGYAAGALGAHALLAAVPQLGELAEIRAEQLFNLDSKDIGPPHWPQLARRVQALRDDPTIGGVVITHGTDTLEETAWFLHLAVHGDKPVVMTAAMRPSTALSADGPMNLWEAVGVAASPAFHGPGVLLALGGEVFGADDFAKAHTIRPAAFRAPQAGPLGLAAPPTRLRTGSAPGAAALPRGVLDRLEALPWVEVLHVSAGADPRLLDALIHAGAAGVVLALPGNGSLPDTWLPAVERAAGAGLQLVRASRVAAGPVTARRTYPALQAAGWCSALQARVLLMLAIASGDPNLFATVAQTPG
ncbi:asparaginase [Pseudothauera nasutitermitis]|uniref:Asparaginase n=1 Tax=Pseudothauera nasutitermitis TaxID=2565930 RepID=A0A4S4ASP2_9RHOO|nr:asparaginase [Pseudothauera nasutitermitis]THF62905.1 asparaginase [Pseudothauera nasutitermitis]